jgi:hypothetical protein
MGEDVEPDLGVSLHLYLTMNSYPKALKALGFFNCHSGYKGSSFKVR